MSHTPLNFLDLPLEDIPADADYAIAQFTSLRDKLFEALGPERRSGATFLEIGPGRNLAVALLVRDLGLEVLVADRFPVPWQPYHGALYAHLQTRLEVPSPALRSCLEAQAHRGVTVVSTPLHALTPIADASVDFVYSCAVLEHACQEDTVARVMDELARISRPGAIHHHFIDGRFHLALEHQPHAQMLMTDQEFQELTAARAAEDGTRLRALEFEAHFARVGFVIEDFHVTELREMPPPQLAGLRRLARSAYRNWPATDLALLSYGVRLRLCADGREARYLMDHGARLLELIAAFKAASRVPGNPLRMWWRSLFRRYGPYRRYLRPIIRHFGVHYVRPLLQWATPGAKDT